MHKYSSYLQQRVRFTWRESIFTYVGKRAQSTINARGNTICVRSKLHVSALLYYIQVRRTAKRRSARERILQVCSVSIRRREFYKRIIKCASQRVENLCRRAYVHRDIVCVESLYCHVNELKISSRAIKNYSQVVNWVKTNFLLLSRFSIIVRVGFSFSWDGSAQLCTTAINHGGRNKMLARWN
jgi:hypothetical protein